MEAPISASQGAMRSLPGKLESLLTEPNMFGLQKGEKNKIRLLKGEIQELIDKYLMEPSEVESPALTANCWAKEVRELSYDIHDFVDELVDAGANIGIVQKTPRSNISRFREKLKRRQGITDEISGFRTRVKEAIQRHRSYLGNCKWRPSSNPVDERPPPPLYGEAGLRLAAMDKCSIGELYGWLTNDGQPKRKVVSIVGSGGVGKTTLANELYRKLGGQFQCRAFVRTSRRPDMKRLLTSILSQVRRHQPPEAWETHNLVLEIDAYLKDKTYFIIIDDLWASSTWDIINRALPKNNCCSRILTTTEVDVVAQTCCADNSNHIASEKEDNSMYIFKKEPLSEDESRELFSNRVFGHQSECPEHLEEVQHEIIKIIGGLPLTIITTASVLACQPASTEQWNYIKNSLSSNLITNANPERIKQVLDLGYSNLPHRLKACMLYLSLYEDDYIIWKDDLVKQWIAEGFIYAMEGNDREELARSYFDELVNRGMIQPVDINCNDEVLSCTVHRMLLHLIRYKSIEENFITAIDHTQTAIRLADKVRRLSLHFSNAEHATRPASLRLSQVRSLSFFGLFKCIPSIVQFKLLQVLILQLWVEHGGMSYDLTEISELFRLRCLHINAYHLHVILPMQMQRLKVLETLKIEAKVTAVPSDIVDLPRVSYLSLPSEADLPTGIGRMTSLRTLGSFDLGSNSGDNVKDLGKLTDLQDLHLTCSTVQPANNLENNMKCLGSILGKLRSLKCLTLVPAGSSNVETLQDDAGASDMSISSNGFSMVPPLALLQRLELSRRCCIFSSLPKCIEKHDNLCILKIAVRKLSREDIDILEGLRALTALSLYIQTAPAERIVFRKAGFSFSVLKFFKFRCSAPRLLIEKDAMPKLQKLRLGFNAPTVDQHNTTLISIEHLSGLMEISAKIWGAGADAESILMTAVSNDPSNPKINEQLVNWKFYGDEGPCMATKEILHRAPEQQGEIQEVYPDKYYRTQHEGSGEDEKKQAERRISMQSESPSPLPVSGPQRSLVHVSATSACVGMEAALGAVQWVVGQALALVADGVLAVWGAKRKFGLNIEALRTELLHVKAMLEIARGKQLGSPAMGTLLQKLRDSAHNAEDLLDELDYFRIHDELHGTYDAADEHAKGGVHDLVLNACHITKVVGKLLGLSACSSAASPGDLGEEDARQRVSCCAWPRARQRVRGNSSSAPNANQADDAMHKLGKLLPYSSFPHVHDDDEKPMLGFNMVDVSERMKHIIEELQHVHREVTTILQSCGRNTVPDIAQSRPINTDRSIEAKFYGRDSMMNSIIYDITKGKYCGKDLTVLPIVGPGGIGKTTLVQHIYHNQEVQNHFQVVIWVCVSLSFNLSKLLEEIKKHIPRVEGEKEGTTEELIEQRIKSKRFLLVLDNIWECSNEDWERLLLPLKRSQEMGSMILVTTRFQSIAHMVKTTKHPIALEGLEFEEFRKLFLVFVFGNEQCRRDHTFLLETGDKIMAKLKGSPLAAKTIGRLLRNDLSLDHWRRVLECKEWEMQTSIDDIMPALKLSYDYLPFHLQQCFSYSALFPEDYHFKSSQLICLWIGLDILQPGARKQTYEEIGLSNLNELVTHGFFKEEEIDGCPCYVMHDLLYELALMVASHECLSLHRSNVGSVQIQPCIRHLSIIIDDVGHNNAVSVSGENFKSELRKLKTKLKVEYLQTLMLFGGMDESFANILGDLFREATALRVLYLPRMSYSVESILHNFSTLVHLRYLCLGTKLPYESQMHLPLTISRFYHLRILDLGSWYSSCDLPKDMSNLAKLCRFYTSRDELHSDIRNVGKLKLLEELKVFRVNKESEGFEPKQLEHLRELRELGIYNLGKIHTKEEAAEAKLMEKNYLQRLTLDWHRTKPMEKNYLQGLTLDWDSCAEPDDWDSCAEPDAEAVVLESLQPHRDLQELCIRGHGGPSCSTWLGDELAVEALQSLHLTGVSWEVLPSFGKMWDLRKLILEHITTVKDFVIEQSFCRLMMLKLVGLGSFKKWVPGATTHLFPLLQVLIIRDCPKLLELPFSNQIVCPLEQKCNINWFPKLQELEIERCPELLLVAHIPWTRTLCSVKIRGVKLIQKLVYLKSSTGARLEIVGKDDLHSLDQVLASGILTELLDLTLRKCPPLELKHLMMLTSLKTLIAQTSPNGLVGPLGDQDDVEWQLPVERLKVWSLCGRELTELLTHLPRLSKLDIEDCGRLTQLVVGVDLQQTTSTTALEVEEEEDGVLLFPAHLSDTLRELRINGCTELVLVDRRTLLPDGHKEKTGGEWLQSLRSLQSLTIEMCPKFLSAFLFSSPSCRLFPSFLQDLRLWDVKGMETLEPLSNLTSLTRLAMDNCGEDLRCEGLLPLLSELIVFDCPRFFAGWDPNPTSPSSSTLLELWTDEATGLLASPICSLLSSSLTRLVLYGIKAMERFTKEQEDALHHLASLQELSFYYCDKLQHLPAGLHKLTNLKRLEVWSCPAVRSLQKDGLPKSLQVLDVSGCYNKELKQQCRGLVGTIPKVRLELLG